MDLNIDEMNLFLAIMNYGKGSKMLKYANQTPAFAPTLFLGEGTVRNELLNKFGLSEMKKEIFIAMVDTETEDDFYQKMKKKYQMEKANHGVAFSIAIKNLSKINSNEVFKTTKNESVNKLNNEAIFAIVDRGLSHELVDLAQAAGSSGGTIIHGRGAGNKEKAKLFNIDIEPEKDIVIILAKTDQTDGIIQSIKKDLNLSDPGNGIIFVLDVNKTVGLYEK